MPRGDGTGPGGMGPMTGRAAGYCAGYGVPGYANPIGGRGMGFGLGFGRGRGGGRGWGWRNMYYAAGPAGMQMAAMGQPPFMGAAPFVGAAPYAGPAAMPLEQELQALRAQAEYFQGALDNIGKRIEELEQESGK